MKRSEIKRRPLSDTVIANLEPELKEYRELDGNGLYIRVALLHKGLKDKVILIEPNSSDNLGMRAT